MATIQRFEDVEAWQLGRVLTQSIYQTSKQRSFAKDFALRGQIRSAVISITSNIAEGFEHRGDREFLDFLSFAKESAGEVRSQLYVALDEGYIDQKKFDRL